MNSKQENEQDHFVKIIWCKYSFNIRGDQLNLNLGNFQKYISVFNTDNPGKKFLVAHPTELGVVTKSLSMTYQIHFHL